MDIEKAKDLLYHAYVVQSSFLSSKGNLEALTELATMLNDFEPDIRSLQSSQEADIKELGDLLAEMREFAQKGIDEVTPSASAKPVAPDSVEVPAPLIRAVYDGIKENDGPLSIEQVAKDLDELQKTAANVGRYLPPAFKKAESLMAGRELLNGTMQIAMDVASQALEQLKAERFEKGDRGTMVTAAAMCLQVSHVQLAVALKAAEAFKTDGEEAACAVLEGFSQSTAPVLFGQFGPGALLDDNISMSAGEANTTVMAAETFIEAAASVIASHGAYYLGELTNAKQVGIERVPFNVTGTAG